MEGDAAPGALRTGHVLRGLIAADAAVIFPQRHIQYPVYRVSDAPVTARGRQQWGGVRGQAEGGVEGFRGDPPVASPLALHRHQASAVDLNLFRILL